MLSCITFPILYQKPKHNNVVFVQFLGEFHCLQSKLLASKLGGCFNHRSLWKLYKYARLTHFLSLHIAKNSRECCPYNFMRERVPREFSKLIWSLRRLLYPFLKPDQNSVCCLLLNYVSLKHKCVGFRKLQISAFPYDLGKWILTNFVWGEKILFALFYNTRELSAWWSSNFCGRESCISNG